MQDPSPSVIDTLRECDAVCFDVDSTFCEDESIDEIAAFLGVGEQVAELTARAMGGSVPFRDALAARLGVMQPSQAALEKFLASHPPMVTPGIPELVWALQRSGRRVFLVSGGFRQVIHPLADSLSIPRSHVFANTILFNPDGSYAGFDEDEFTSRSGGKAEAVRHLRARDGLRRVVMVGDGMTDVEARQPGGADVFVGYGGSVFRPNIAELADWYVMDIARLAGAFGFDR